MVSSPGGIDCGGTCSASFDSGTAVTLARTPEPGSTFAGWSGGRSLGHGLRHEPRRRQRGGYASNDNARSWSRRGLAFAYGSADGNSWSEVARFPRIDKGEYANADVHWELPSGEAVIHLFNVEPMWSGEAYMLAHVSVH